ncbi:MAG TPA: ABC transporter permease [Gemmatimonadaceae bacterium]|nr:ABC transporter permease [Gemmatimonadaceae bacterium]
MTTRAAVEAGPQTAPEAHAPTSGHDQSPTVVIDASANWRRWLHDLYVYRGALQSLAWRNIRSRYKQAWLGMSWALLQPAVQTGVFTLLFGVIARVPSGDVPYPVFALAGLLSWNLFAKIVNDGAISLVTNQHIIGKLFFPRLYLVLASGASALIDAAVTSVLLLTAMLVLDVPIAASAWLAIPLLLGLLVFCFGFAALLAAINARWRDVQHTLPLLLQVGLFVTPVLYRNTFIPERWRWVLFYNPLTGFVESLRASVLGLPLPGADVLVPSFGVALVLVVLGVWYFTRTEATIVDVV